MTDEVVIYSDASSEKVASADRLMLVVLFVCGNCLLRNAGGPAFFSVPQKCRFHTGLMLSRGRSPSSSSLFLSPALDCHQAYSKRATWLQIRTTMFKVFPVLTKAVGLIHQYLPKDFLKMVLKVPFERFSTVKEQ